MELQTLVDALSAFGLPGIVASLVILVGVYVAKRAGIVASGNHARIANIVMSAILFGLSDNPSSEGMLGALIASLLAGLAYEGLKRLPIGKG